MPRESGRYDGTGRVIAQPSPGGSSDQIRVSPAAPVRPDAANWRRCGFLVAREDTACQLFALKQPLAAKAKLAGSSDDQVIMDDEAHHLGCSLDPAGHGDIRLRRGWIARGVIVDENQGRGIQLKRPAHDLARVDRDMINGAPCLFLIRDKHVLTVKVKDTELFD